MSNRFWFYLGSLVIVAGLYSWRIASVNAINNEVSRIEQTGNQEQIKSVTRYVAAQSDDKKLVSLAKRLKNGDKEILQIIIDRAYEINPGSRRLDQ